MFHVKQRANSFSGLEIVFSLLLRLKQLVINMLNAFIILSKDCLALEMIK